ncbi:MAG: hypothetical protein ABII10_02620 [Candidatus Paceibacterota bacterium]
MTNLKQKARSRLKRLPGTHARQALIQQKTRLKENSKELRKTVTDRLRFLPLLVFALGFYAGTYWLLTNIRPNQINNLVLPNSYLPFHALLLSANFLFFTFITLSKRWGILIALIIQWLLFLKLQNFNLDMWAWGSALLVGVSGYGLRMLWKLRRT